MEVSGAMMATMPTGTVGTVGRRRAVVAGVITVITGSTTAMAAVDSLPPGNFVEGVSGPQYRQRGGIREYRGGRGGGRRSTATDHRPPRRDPPPPAVDAVETDSQVATTGGTGPASGAPHRRYRVRRWALSVPSQRRCQRRGRLHLGMRRVTREVTSMKTSVQRNGHARRKR